MITVFTCALAWSSPYCHVQAMFSSLILYYYALK